MLYFEMNKTRSDQNINNPELILHIKFNQFVNIYSIAIEAPEESGTETVKLFINFQTIGFNDAKTIENVQSLKFEKAHLKYGLPIEL
ncbi:unnamed protein product [Rotaria sp. Silwood2]|nr:unnamed protein product [Rotaria sp. Silwood2]CAF3337791.1 unnamed protein product [Rotaria sp. Silwood2]CAF4189652.1 unnamed protein product [Rotaria sp. Silwood2]CAF4274984.1 unnamed protein product [Rotaria sp. Silwood2]